MLTYQHTGDLADVIYTRLALHHLPDTWKAIALTRMRSMLREGGVLGIGTGQNLKSMSVLNTRLSPGCSNP